MISSSPPPCFPIPQSFAAPMNLPYGLLSLGVAAALTGLACAQSGGPEDYNFNFHNMGTDAAVFTTGPVLFGALTGNQNFAGPGDSIRTCYGIDSFQGGRNQSTGRTNITHLSWIQGSSLTSNGVSIGLSTVLAQSVDSLDGDACFSSLFLQGNDTITGNPITLNSQFGASFVPPVLFPGPFGGSFLNLSMEVVGSNGIGITLDSTLGEDSNGFPLIPHVIFEVQGPVDGGFDNNQYYLASTSETIGLGTAGLGTGGVTNGNERMGQSIFGAGNTADVTGAISHNRLTGFTPATGLVAGTTVTFNGPQQDHWTGYHLASQTPMAWAINDGSTGGGGPDWSISGPISTINLRTIDIRAGAENPGSGALISEPGLAFNSPFYVWSATPAALMLQEPMSWDTTLGFASPGSQVLGPQSTSRAGLQTVPVNFDALTSAFLSVASLSAGTTHLPALDIDADGSGDIFEFGEGLGTVGEATLPNAVPLVLSPKPGLAGTKLGVVSAGIQLDVSQFTLSITEFSSGVTIVLQ